MALSAKARALCLVRSFCPNPTPCFIMGAPSLGCERRNKRGPLTGFSSFAFSSQAIGQSIWQMGFSARRGEQNVWAFTVFTAWEGQIPDQSANFLDSRGWQVHPMTCPEWSPHRRAPTRRPRAARLCQHSAKKVQPSVKFCVEGAIMCRDLPRGDTEAAPAAYDEICAAATNSLLDPTHRGPYSTFPP